MNPASLLKPWPQGKALALAAQQFAIALCVAKQYAVGNIGMNYDWPFHHNGAVRIRSAKSKHHEICRLRRGIRLNHKLLNFLQVEFSRPVQVPLHGIFGRLVVPRQYTAFLIHGQWEHGAISAPVLPSGAMMVRRAEPLPGCANDVRPLLSRELVHAIWLPL